MSNMDYIAYNSDDEIRQKSSSGGLFNCLAKYFLEHDGVVFGASWTADWTVDMRYINTLEDLPLLMGSKYLQADIKNTFKECKEFLDAGKLVLYCGLPCQLHSLKHFLIKDYPNLYLVDIACHGLLPLNIWKDYLESLKREDANITSINFRLKDPDWNNYAFEVKYSDGKILKEHHSKNKYMQAFLCDKYLKKSCYDCKFKNDFSCADLTIGDAWGETDKLGLSFSILRTAKGKELVDKLPQMVKLNKSVNKQVNGCFYNEIKTQPEVYDKEIFKKKVAIITLPLIDNYGGVLQAFALNKIISDAGYIAETITIQDGRLLEFAKDNINLHIFSKAEDITNIKQDDYDIFVVGSDQIWRKAYTSGNFRGNYIKIPFLQFTNDWNKTRISYAASFGVSDSTWEYSTNEEKRIAEILKYFNAVSVREIQSIKDCKSRLNIDSVSCIDPTLLLSKEFYLQLCEKEKPYDGDVFKYILDDNRMISSKIKEYCDRDNLKVYKTQSKTIESWLAAFRDAKYVITDSFHGCILSIIFHKPFICIYNKVRGNTRFDSLISTLDLQVVYDVADLQNHKPTIIDYDLLENKITESRRFLIQSLKLPPQQMLIARNERQDKPSKYIKKYVKHFDPCFPLLDDYMN